MSNLKLEMYNRTKSATKYSNGNDDDEANVSQKNKHLVKYGKANHQPVINQRHQESSTDFVASDCHGCDCTSANQSNSDNQNHTSKNQPDSTLIEIEHCDKAAIVAAASAATSSPFSSTEVEDDLHFGAKSRSNKNTNHSKKSRKMNVSSNENVPASTLSATLSSSQTNLVRKQSCGDLVSRFKSRKILGVGENCEQRGEVYRSKISQLLGHSDHLFTRFPFAFWQWYTLLVLFNILSGLWNFFGHLISSNRLNNLSSTNEPTERPLSSYTSDSSTEIVSSTATKQDILSIVTFYRQFFAIWNFVFAAMLWRFHRTNDKNLIRSILLICSLYSLAKILLLLYYDHCIVIDAKNWLISFVCPRSSSICSPPIVGNYGDSFDEHQHNHQHHQQHLNRSCSHFGQHLNKLLLPLYEMIICLLFETIQIIINLCYRHKMQFNASNVNSGGGVAGDATVTPTVSLNENSQNGFFCFGFFCRLLSNPFRLLVSMLVGGGEAGETATTAANRRSSGVTTQTSEISIKENIKKEKKIIDKKQEPENRAKIN